MSWRDKPCLIIGTSRQSRKVWERLHGPIPTGLNVCHHCDERLCREPSHLFLGTQSVNILDAVAKGRWNHARHTHRRRSEQHPNRALSIAAIEDIRTNYVPRCTPLRVFAERYGVCTATVYKVVREVTW